MTLKKRDLWLKDPRVKSAAERQGFEVPGKVGVKRCVYDRLNAAILANGDWSRDTIRFCDESWRLEFEFVGVDLLGTNTLLRCHQAKVNSYRNQWKNRAGTLILQSQKSVRDWHRGNSYPVRYEVGYVSEHSNLMDEDNLIGAAKMVVDEIVRQTPVPDDSPDYLRYPIVESKTGKQSNLLIVFYPITQSPVSAETLGWIEQQS